MADLSYNYTVIKSNDFNCLMMSCETGRILFLRRRAKKSEGKKKTVKNLNLESGDSHLMVGLVGMRAAPSVNGAGITCLSRHTLP